MTRVARSVVIAAPSEEVKTSRVISALMEATKPGITRLVTITSTVGFVLAAAPKSWTISELAIAGLSSMAGTALSAAGANAINQWMERARDARMDRTKNRPLPSGRVTPGSVLWTGVALSVAGVMVLAIFANIVAALLSLACLLVYLLAYTPLKPRTTLATLVGAIPGALPPLIGWAAASPGNGWAALGEWGGWSLFALMFAWQMRAASHAGFDDIFVYVEPSQFAAYQKVFCHLSAHLKCGKPGAGPNVDSAIDDLRSFLAREPKGARENPGNHGQ